MLFYRFIRLLLLLLFTIELKTIDIEGIEMTLDLTHFLLTDTELVLVIYEANLTCLGIAILTGACCSGFIRCLNIKHSLGINKSEYDLRHNSQVFYVDVF
jgi:hypothetical protein